MARVGEGDPRWIVSERQDGSNVNAWHWEERDLSKHTHAELQKRLAGLLVAEKAGDVDRVEITEATEVGGDVTVAQRKGKMMCYFELKLSLNWTASVGDATVKGKMEIPEVDHDNFTDDYHIAVSCQEGGARAGRAEDVIRNEGRKKVRAIIAAYFDALFVEYQIGKTLTSGAAMPPPPPPPPKASPEHAESPTSPSPATAAKTTGEGTSFSWKMRWYVPAADLFSLLTDQQRASVYTRSPAVIDPRTGGQFKFIGGVISGYYAEVEGPTSLRMQWRLSSWSTGVHSSVVMMLVREEPGVTLLEFAQSGIPEGQVESVKEGWRANFFDAMKMVFGLRMEYV